MPRKQLNCSEEDFFLMVQLVCGPPLPAAFAYVGPDRWSVGVQGWLQHTDEGRKFTRCVTNCGEAKQRAPSWYKAYRNWWIKQHSISFEQWRKRQP